MQVGQVGGSHEVLPARDREAQSGQGWGSEAEKMYESSGLSGGPGHQRAASRREIGGKEKRGKFSLPCEDLASPWGREGKRRQ